MGRRPKDEFRDRAFKRLVEVIDNKWFKEFLEYLQPRWQEAGQPNYSQMRLHEIEYLDWRLREPHVYTGLYFDLRHVCDALEMPWPHSGWLIIDFLIAVENNLDVMEILTKQYWPPAQHWKWFRLARTGLGIVRTEELAEIEQRKELIRTPHLRDRNFRDGLPYEVIAEWEEVSDRNVAEAVRGCIRYLEEGRDFGILKLDEIYDAREYSSLLFWPDK